MGLLRYRASFVCVGCCRGTICFGRTEHYGVSNGHKSSAHSGFLLAGYVRHFFRVVYCNNLTRDMPRINDRIVFEIIGILSAIAIVQGVYAKVPQVEQFLLPAKDWFAGISSTEWSYIAGICALKVCIISIPRKLCWNWDWRFEVMQGFSREQGVIVLLAAVALAFAIWPSHLPDGMALKSGMDQVLPYVALPIRFLGHAVYWPVCIALWALGFAGRMAVSLVLWIISLFM